MISIYLSACLLLGAQSAAASQETIVFVLLDATRADHLSAYGYGRPTTPNIDAIAATGTRFVNTYSNAPWTRPSSASFLTGLNTSRHRTETETSKLPANVPTLAEQLEQTGFRTAAFVANGHAGSLAGLQRGFTVFEDPSRTYVRGQRGQTLANGLPVGAFVVDHALKYLATASAPKQFVFLFLIDAHDPYEAPPELERMFLGDFNGTVRRRAAWEYNNNYPADERFSMMAVYDAGLRSADQAVGTLVAGLKAQGRLASTTFVISADHGEGFGEHQFYLHAHHFWEEVIHIPLIIAGPRWRAHVPKPGTDARLSQSLDVTRTLAALAETSQQATLPGHILYEPATQEPVISEYNEYGIHRQAIFNEAYKVIWQRPADEAWYMRTAKDKKFFPSVSFDHEVIQVFDRHQDPGEVHDLSDSMPPDAAALLKRLRSFVQAAPAKT